MKTGEENVDPTGSSLRDEAAGSGGGGDPPPDEPEPPPLPPHPMKNTVERRDIPSFQARRVTIGSA